MPSAVRSRDQPAAKVAFGPLGRSGFGELTDGSHASYVLRFHLLHPVNHWMRPGKPKLQSSNQVSPKHLCCGEIEPSEAATGIIHIIDGGDTVSTEAVATRRHAGRHLPAIGWKYRTANTELALAA